MAQKSATDAFETASKNAIQKASEANSDLIGNIIADRITKTVPQSTTSKSTTPTQTETSTRVPLGKLCTTNGVTYIFLQEKNNIFCPIEKMSICLHFYSFTIYPYVS